MSKDTGNTNAAPATEGADVPAQIGIGDLSEWLVQPERVRIRFDEFQCLNVSIDGNEFKDVRPRRVFPLSSRADYVSFAGEKGHEVLLFARPSRLDRESRQALDKALDRVYHRVQILQVYEIKETQGGVAHWRVRTDRGHATFEIVERNERVRFMPPGRFLILDVDGNRFEIEDIRKLDAHSQSEVYHET